MTLLEAASTGVPIICSDIKENMAVFDESEVTFFRVGDPKDLGDKILWVSRNMDEAESMAMRAYQKLIHQYLWKDIAEKYSSLYLEIMD